MNKKALKKRLIEVHQVIIEDLKTAVQTYHEGKDLDEEDTMDPEDFSHQAESGHLELTMQQKLEQSQAEMRFIEALNTEAHDKVGPGALVELETMWLYVSVATKPFTFEGKEIHGISTQAPIYSSLEDRAAGDKVKVGQKEQVIVSVS